MFKFDSGEKERGSPLSFGSVQKVENETSKLTIYKINVFKIISIRVSKSVLPKRKNKRHNSRSPNLQMCFVQIKKQDGRLPSSIAFGSQRSIHALPNPQQTNLILLCVIDVIELKSHFCSSPNHIQESHYVVNELRKRTQ